MEQKPIAPDARPTFRSEYPPFESAADLYQSSKLGLTGPNRLLQPRHGEHKKAALHFVVQEHRATQAGLHYDLRLQRDGVLWSWVVQQPPPQTPGASCLAIRVADHPLHYRHFTGTIPAGHYGAGEVIIWDRGSLIWVSLTPPFQFMLKGRKLQGTYALQPFEKNYLLVKE